MLWQFEKLSCSVTRSSSGYFMTYFEDILELPSPLIWPKSVDAWRNNWDSQIDDWRRKGLTVQDCHTHTHVECSKWRRMKTSKIENVNLIFKGCIRNISDSEERECLWILTCKRITGKGKRTVTRITVITSLNPLL